MTVSDVLDLNVSIDYSWLNYDFRLLYDTDFFYTILKNKGWLITEFGEYHAMLVHVTNDLLNKDYPFVEKNL